MRNTNEQDIEFALFDLEEANRAKRVALKDMQIKRPKNAKKSKKDTRTSS